jgi:hypothetical protein
MRRIHVPTINDRINLAASRDSLRLSLPRSLKDCNGVRPCYVNVVEYVQLHTCSTSSLLSLLCNRTALQHHI